MKTMTTDKQNLILLRVSCPAEEVSGSTEGVSSKKRELRETVFSFVYWSNPVCWVRWKTLPTE